MGAKVRCLSRGDRAEKVATRRKLAFKRAHRGFPDQNGKMAKSHLSFPNGIPLFLISGYVELSADTTFQNLSISGTNNQFFHPTLVFILLNEKFIRSDPPPRDTWLPYRGFPFSASILRTRALIVKNRPRRTWNRTTAARTEIRPRPHDMILQCARARASARRESWHRNLSAMHPRKYATRIP